MVHQNTKEKLLGILMVSGMMAKNKLSVSHFMATSCSASPKRQALGKVVKFQNSIQKKLLKPLEI